MRWNNSKICSVDYIEFIVTRHYRNSYIIIVLDLQNKIAKIINSYHLHLDFVKVLQFIFM